VGEDRGIAWLFSSEYLSEEELVLASERVKEGEPPAPSRRLRRLGERALGFSPPSEALDTRGFLRLLFGCLLLTPLLGLAVWWGASHDQPAMARQGMAASLLTAVLLGASLILFMP
jgi:hypothetical protein